MGRIDSRKKGARGERKACEVLKAWTGYDFHRVPQSGGLHWKSANTEGDLVCGDPLHRFNFSIEVKNYRDINFEHLLMPGVKSKITDEFWPQCLADSQRAKKIPLLLMRYDGIRPGDLFFAVMLNEHYVALKTNGAQFKKKFPYLKCGKLIIMNSYHIFKADYNKVDLASKTIISKQWT